MKNTKIEWADHTFNPWIGCTKVNQTGCANCYAEKSMPAKFLGVQWGTHAERRRTSESNWKQPLRWNAEAEKLGVRYRVFCASLADVFDNDVPVQWRQDLFELIEKTPHLDWLLLTKRIGNAQRMIEGTVFPAHRAWPWPNVWLGTTICNQEEADRDIPKLLAVPAAKRFLSIEPLLCTVNLSGWLTYCEKLDKHGISRRSGGEHIVCDKHCGISWVIVGGESGPNARPMHPDWVRGLRDQCNAAAVPFFFKQWGAFVPALSGMWYYPLVGMPQFMPRAFGKDAHDFGGGLGAVHIGKKHAGCLLDGREWNEIPRGMAHREFGSG